MNSIFLIGRTTKEPDVRLTQSGTTVAAFTLAIDRPTKQGEEKKADFPRITAFGKQAEVCERYLAKGKKVAVEGRLQTGSYQDKDGKTVYTTDVIANRVEILEWPDTAGSQQNHAGGYGGGMTPPHSAKPAPQIQPGSYQQSVDAYHAAYPARDQGINRPYPGPPQEQQQTIFAGQQQDDIPPNFAAVDEEVPF